MTPHLTPYVELGASECTKWSEFRGKIKEIIRTKNVKEKKKKEGKEERRKKEKEIEIL